jgi:hypothetical protein
MSRNTIIAHDYQLNVYFFFNGLLFGYEVR